jgi:hypothetical protein
VALAVGAFLLGASASWAVSAEASPGAVPVSAEAAIVGGCSFSIEPETHRELVVETDVKGRIVVWHKGSEWRSFVAPAGDVEYFNLKRRHRDVSHFTVAVVKLGSRHNHEHITWCQPA